MRNYYTRWGKYAQACQKAAGFFLQERKEPVLLSDLTSVMDTGARVVGMKGEFGDSIWDYTHLLPVGWSCWWMKKPGHTGAVVLALPPGYKGEWVKADSPDT
jgi:hypothetical protein